MSQVFIVGGSGQIARLLATTLSKGGHQVQSMYRNPSQKEALQALGAKPILGNLLELTPQELSELMKGSDTVVFSAGAGGKGGMEMTDAIDGKGLELSVKAAEKAGIKRFILVSAFPEAGRDKALGEGFENYMRIKKAADVYLTHSTLDWVIVRPGTLTDHHGSKKINVGPAIAYGDVSRENVALTLAQIIEHPKIKKIIIELTDGDTDIPHAIAAL